MQKQAETPPHVLARDLGVPILIALGLFFLRDRITARWCAVDPTPCVIDSVNAFDRVVFQYGYVPADFASNVLQNIVGGIIFLSPFAFAWWFKPSRQARAFADFLAFVTVTLWNVALMECVRALVQRPRPLIFRNALGDGANIHLYNSFYSGHTSFTALITLSFWLYCVRLFPGRTGLHRGLLIFSFLCTVTMGILRVWGGRHYPTDVLVGASVGWLLAILFHRYRLKRDGIENELALPS